MRSIDEYALPGTEEERAAAWPMVLEHGGLVVWVTNRYVNRLMLRRGKTTPYFMRLSRQDLFEELYPAALEGALKAALDYDEKRGAFSTFATVVIEHALMDALDRLMKTFDRDSMSVDPEWLRRGIVPGYDHTVKILFEDNGEEISDDRVAAAFGTLAEPEQRALALRAEGKTYAEISKVLETSTSQAFNLVNKARKKMIEELGGDDDVSS